MQKQIFPVESGEFSQLKTLTATLEDMCTEPSKTGKTDPSKEQKSRRKQLVQLRNELRETLANVDAKLEADEGPEIDPELEAAKEIARERAKRPPHLRGAQLLKETIGAA